MALRQYKQSVNTERYFAFKCIHNILINFLNALYTGNDDELAPWERSRNKRFNAHDLNSNEIPKPSNSVIFIVVMLS